MKMNKTMMTIGFIGICGRMVAGSLEVRGQADLCFPPDGMRVHFSIDATDADMTKGKDIFAQKNRAVMQALKDVGVSTNEICSSDFEVSPVYHYEDVVDKEEVEEVDEDSGKLKKVINLKARDRRVFDGYCHSMRYEIESKLDRDRLEKIYIALVKSGVGKSLSFDFFLLDSSNARAKARRQAVNNAKSAAEELCDAVGAKICGVQRINYDDNDAYFACVGSMPAMPSERKERKEQPDDAPVFPDFTVKDIRISDSVRIIWDVK